MVGINEGLISAAEAAFGGIKVALFLVVFFHPWSRTKSRCGEPKMYNFW
jgi:hypothetical protein